MFPDLNLHDYKWMEYADVLRLAQLGLLQYAQKNSHVFYVLAEDGIDGQNRGGKIIAPVKTLDNAVGKVESGRGDFIIILPARANSATGVPYTLTDGDVSLAKTDFTIAGLVPPAMGSTVIKPTTDPSTAILIAANTSNRIVLKNLRINGAGDGGNDVLALSGVGLASYLDGFIIEDCWFELCGNGIVTSNAGSAADWIIRNNKFLNCDNGVTGYFHNGEIYGNKISKTLTTALTAGIELLDNGATADSDGCEIHNNVVLGGIEGTTPVASGIKVASACYGVGIWENKVSGCTDNLSYTANTAAAQAMFNMTDDGRNGGGEWADAETYLLT